MPDGNLRLIHSPFADAEALGHLIALLNRAADMMEDALCDVDAAYIRGHAAQLARGHEWPGDRITSTLDPNPVATARAREGR